MLAQIKAYVVKGVRFAFETTLSGRGYARMIPEWRAQGDVVKLFFFVSAQCRNGHQTGAATRSRRWTLDSE